MLFAAIEIAYLLQYESLMTAAVVALTIIIIIIIAELTKE